jgi:hypothetical protein
MCDDAVNILATPTKPVRKMFAGLYIVLGFFVYFLGQAKK